MSPPPIIRTEDGVWLGIPSDEMTPDERHRKYLYDLEQRGEEIEITPHAHAPIVMPPPPEGPSLDEIASDQLASQQDRCAVCGIRPAVATGEDGRRICTAPTCVKRARLSYHERRARR